MKSWHIIMLLLGFGFFVPGLALAGSPVIHETTLPYEPLSIDSAIEQRQVYMGALEGNPHLYEVTLTTAEKLTLTVLQAPSADPIPFSFILISENTGGRGVSEIGRYKGTKAEWTKHWYGTLGLSLMAGETQSYDLAPGVYRFEISTSGNFGRYLLVIGTETTAGYWDKWREMRATQSFLEVSLLRSFASSLVLYPLGILGLIGAFYLLWRRRR